MTYKEEFINIHKIPSNLFYLHYVNYSGWLESKLTQSEERIKELQGRCEQLASGVTEKIYEILALEERIKELKSEMIVRGEK